MITLEKLTSANRQAVKNVVLAQEQIKYAGTAEEFLAEASETVHLHVIKFDHQVVGFFKIDVAYSQSYAFCPPTAVGLRAFVIGLYWQGKGVGSAAVKALFPYLQQYYSSYQTVYLTVNCKNPNAQRCYKKSGFSESPELYLGGSAGPQHIMYAEIES